MLKNYLKIALRTLVHNRTYSVINIAGLALGMAVSVLILIFVMHELSFDRFHANHQRIFRLVAQIKIDGNDLQMTGFNQRVGPALKSTETQVKDFVRVKESYEKVVIKSPATGQLFYEENFLFADPSFFTVFSFKFKEGSTARALDKPFTLVISERAAQKYFGAADPVGKTLLYDGKHPMQITGIMENAPSNSTFDLDFITSTASFPQLSAQNKDLYENEGVFTTYLLLDSEASVGKVEKAIGKLSSTADFLSKNSKYVLDQFSTIHLGNNFGGVGAGKMIPIFAGIALLILFLALFNYMSLTTARSTLRAKEVGVRKVVGAGKKGLVAQFYMESVLVCTIAFLLSFVLVNLLMQPFYNLLDLHIDAAFLLSPQFMTFLVALLVVTAMVAGSYPALVLSGFAPLEVLKGRFSRGQSGAAVRKTFMVFQFTVSITLIVCSLVVKDQLTFLQNKELGLYKDQVLAIPITQSLANNYFPLRNEIRDRAGVNGVSATNSGLFKGYNIWFLKNFTTRKDVGLITMVADNNFVKTMGLKLKVAPQPGTYKNRNYVLLNEAAVKELGVKGNPVGQKIGDKDEIAGIVSNFHYNSPQEGIRGLGLYVMSDTTNILKYSNSSGVLYARLDPKADIKANVEAIGQIFKKYELNKPFEYYFLDDAFNETFQTEVRMSKMFSLFTGVAIFIACMGLFGLVTFTAETRTKEIGIRKVLGASVAGIITLLSKDFIKLVLLSIVFSLPVAWYFMEKWLEDFSYRIQIPVWIYLTASLAAIVIALITISFQSIRAALMNPADTLRRD
ncbi:ABC transporter permease [Dyadobacter crusticola]|uniref:ABC transporter permease n=1 Tax=Dyadobacter crusticola TaxID=292407 RepID=UPI0004E12C92|nr:ABC transporter permease [Dyadobacter crusticola]